MIGEISSSAVDFYPFLKKKQRIGCAVLCRSCNDANDADLIRMCMSIRTFARIHKRYLFGKCKCANPIFFCPYSSFCRFYRVADARCTASI